MRTFYHPGKAGSTWHIQLEGETATVTTTDGTGPLRTRTFADGYDARQEYDEQIDEKLAAGYVETTGLEGVPAERLALESALVADPDDLASHRAYADWLTEHGDPRGEFVQVQLALEDPARPPAQRKELQQREQALLQKHQEEWIGPLSRLVGSAGPGLVPSFARGWIDSLVVDSLYRRLAPLLTWEPRFRLVRRLSISDFMDPAHHGLDVPLPDVPPPEPVEEYADPLGTLARSPYLGNVRVLALGDSAGFLEDFSEASSYNSVADLPALGVEAWHFVERLPRLEELYVAGTVYSPEWLFAAQALTRLRVLQVFLADEYPLTALATNAALGNLTHLSLRPRGYSHHEEEWPFLRLDDVSAVLRSKYLTSLTHLRIQQHDLGDQLCEEVVQSGVLKRLTFLDLARGAITDVGAMTLARCPDLKHLRVLDVSRNAIGAAGVAALRGSGVEVRAAEQHDADDTEYLYEGEWE